MLQRPYWPNLASAALLTLSAAAIGATAANNIAIAHSWLEIALYAIVAPSLIWLAIDFLLCRNLWFSLLFLGLAAERIHLLIQIAGSNADMLTINPAGMIIIIFATASILIRLVIGRILARVANYYAANHA